MMEAQERVGQNHSTMASSRAVLIPADPSYAPSDGRFSYVIPERSPYPCAIGCIRRHIFKSFILFVFLATAVWLTGDYFEQTQSANGDIHLFIRKCKLLSVPLVSLLFTWFHVWLALQMMFYPIEFYGCPRRAIVPKWLGLPVNGWQGIVPRKAGDMARRCCEKMIGNICTVDEFMDRVQPDHFWETLHGVFGTMCSEVLTRLISKRFPTVWANLPQSVKKELQMKVEEETKNAFLPAMTELKGNINSIIDIKVMATEALANDPRLMVDMFREVASRELVFITHVAAVMGFVLGLVQVGLYMILEGTWKYTDFIMLPVSGLIIGYFTNWLALKMTFQPVWPHFYCGKVINIQGVFLKRQKEAANQMSTLICQKVIDARAMFNYIIQSPSQEGLEKVLEIYRKHMHNTVEQSCGSVRSMTPSFVSREIDTIKEDVVNISLEILPQYTSEIEKYMDETMQIAQTLDWRLSRVPPPEFENIIHPIFQEDEWILLVVGGVLGVIIGLLQAWALQTIH